MKTKALSGMAATSYSSSLISPFAISKAIALPLLLATFHVLFAFLEFFFHSHVEARASHHAVSREPARSSNRGGECQLALALLLSTAQRRVLELFGLKVTTVAECRPYRRLLLRAVSDRSG